MKWSYALALGLVTVLMAGAANAQPPREETQAPRGERPDEVQAPRG